MAMHRLEEYVSGADTPSEVYDLVGVCLRDLRMVMGGWVGDPALGERYPVEEEHLEYFKSILGDVFDMNRNDYYLLLDRGGETGWLDDDFGDPVVA